MTECDFANLFASTPPPPSSPPQPSLPPFTGPKTPQRNPRDSCFSCRRPGHWAKECPNKSPKKSQTSSPGSSSMSSSGLLLIRCPCGRGTCPVFTSRTQKNPDRKFYTCPGDRSSANCNFFKWCDELSIRAPMCPCGVGICSLNLSRESTGPNGEKWYFACRIKKNHGACSFFQWADSEINTMMKRHVHTAINDLDNKEVSSNVLPELPVVEADTNATNLPTSVTSVPDEVPNGDLIMQDVESKDQLQVLNPTHQSQSHCLKELKRQISGSGRTITQDVIYQVLGLHGYGWLGRLAFPPSQGMKDLPVLPIFCCISPSFDRVTILEDVNISEIEESFPLTDSASNTATDMPLSPNPRQDTQILGGAFEEASGLNEPFGITQDESKSILKEYGLALLNTLEPMSPVRHGAMVKVAEATLKILQNLSIECGPFGENVKEYIHNRSKLASIEVSMSKGLSSQELIKVFDSEKVQYDNVSRLHAEAATAYRASNNHLQSLQEEVSRVKNMLLQLEKQLFSCETETLARKTRVDEISEDMLEAKKSMEAASEKMKEALELERQRDSVNRAAKAALETARVWLEK